MNVQFCGSDYIRKSEDAARRLKRGERQRQCATCGLWRWAEQPCDHIRETGRTEKGE